MSSVRRSFSDIVAQKVSVEALVSGLIALPLLGVSLDGRSLLALTLASRLLVVLSPTHFGQNAGLFAGTLETAERRIEILVLTYTYAGHVKITVLNN